MAHLRLISHRSTRNCKFKTKFLEANMAHIRNKTGFFIGILKRYRKIGYAAGRREAPAPAWAGEVSYRDTQPVTCFGCSPLTSHSQTSTS